MMKPIILTVTRPIWFLLIALLLYIIFRIALFIVINIIEKLKLLDSIQKVGGCIAGGLLSITVCCTVIILLNIAHPEITTDSLVYNIIANKQT